MFVAVTIIGVALILQVAILISVLSKIRRNLAGLHAIAWAKLEPTERRTAGNLLTTILKDGGGDLRN